MTSLHPEKLKTAIKYINHWLDINFQNSRLPGMQVAVQHGDTLVYSAAFGYADLEAGHTLTTKHTFRIASHSKTFTATAIMQLVENGKLHLDDRVSQHLPWFRSSKDERVATITARQLLNHTAGIIRDGSDADYWHLLRPFPEADELQEHIASSVSIYNPDENFKYSNYGYGYLGLVIEAVSGISYHNYITEHILKKLNLASTGPNIDSDALPLRAKGYGAELFGSNRTAFDNIDTKALSSATGFYSNGEDICRYFSAHFMGDTSIISDASKRQMQHGYWRVNGKSEHYGLGLGHYKKDGWNVYGHGGGMPGFRTHTLFDAGKQLVITVLINATDGQPQGICGKLVDIIDTFQQDTDHIPTKAKDISRFEGSFYDIWGALDIVAVGKRLFAVAPLNWTDFSMAEELSVVNETTLRIEHASGFSAPGETIVYTFKRSGEVNTIKSAGKTLLTLAEARKKGWFA